MLIWECILGSFLATDDRLFRRSCQQGQHKKNASPHTPTRSALAGTLQVEPSWQGCGSSKQESMQLSVCPLAYFVLKVLPWICMHEIPQSDAECLLDLSNRSSGHHGRADTLASPGGCQTGQEYACRLLPAASDAAAGPQVQRWAVGAPEACPTRPACSPKITTQHLWSAALSRFHEPCR